MLWRVIVAVSLLAAPTALARGWSEHWTATSTTAISITGDVTLKPTEMVFADGKSLPIRKVKNISFTDDIGKTGPATIYRITKPADPALLQGNRICGGGTTVIPVTFVVIWHTQPIMPGEAVGRAFAAFSGPAAPTTVNGMCGIFRYDITK